MNRTYKVKHSFTRKEQIEQNKSTSWADHGIVRDVLKIKQVERRLRRKLTDEELNSINLKEEFGIRLYKMPYDLVSNPHEVTAVTLADATASGYVTPSTLETEFRPDSSDNENESV